MYDQSFRFWIVGEYIHPVRQLGWSFWDIPSSANPESLGAEKRESGAQWGETRWRDTDLDTCHMQAFSNWIWIIVNYHESSANFEIFDFQLPEDPVVFGRNSLTSKRWSSVCCCRGASSDPGETGIQSWPCLGVTWTTTHVCFDKFSEYSGRYVMYQSQ